MTYRTKILVVDDALDTVKLLTDRLDFEGYAVVSAISGMEAMKKIGDEHPDLVLLDVTMPEMSGYEVCRRIRDNADTRLLPVIMVTGVDHNKERVKGIEAGADDFLPKPINQAELLARVRSLLRIKELHDQVKSQARELAEWSRTLEDRVQEQVAQLQRFGVLKRFFSPQLVELILSGGADDPLTSHRQNITVVFLDLRGFTTFGENTEPEEVMEVLREYHAEMGRLIVEYSGTLERFTGDGMMIFFNDPVEIPNPDEQAVGMAEAMRSRAEEIRAGWTKRGHDLSLGIGIASGDATIGKIGFEGRWDYGAIGSVTNLALRLCGEAKPGQILISQRVFNSVETTFETEPVGELTLKGFRRPVPTYEVVRKTP